MFSGQGLVWYDGAPRVEGISNPLWTVLIDALQKLPGFSEDRLGLYVIVLNAMLLVSVLVLFARSARYVLTVSSSSPAALSGVAVLLLPWSVALTYWSAEGFEVAMVAALTFAALQVALLPRTRARALMLGAVLAAGVATRMDFVLLASAVCLIAVAHGVARERPWYGPRRWLCC